MSKTDTELDVSEHLKELKKRILLIMVCFVSAFIFFYCNSNKVIDFIVQSGNDAGFQFVYITPAEILTQQLKLAAIASIVICIPIIIIEISAFVAPALENGYIGAFIPMVFAVIMFCIGVAFSYFILIPFVFNSLYNLGVNVGIEGRVSIESYISLYMTLLLSLGLTFELPLISLGLSRLHVVDCIKMKKGRKVAVIISLFIAAIITPPDVFSQIVVAVPIMLLYEFSIWLCRVGEKKHVVTVSEE